MATAQSDSGSHALASPPAIDYPLARSRLLIALAGFVWTLAVVIDGYWLLVAPAGDWRPWAGAMVTACVAWLSWRSGPLTQSGVLIWDGAAWFWAHSAVRLAGRVAVRLDMQSGLLLRFVVDGGSSRWFWLEQASRPGDWLALRRAVAVAARRPRDEAGEPGNQAAHP